MLLLMAAEAADADDNERRDGHTVKHLGASSRV